MTTSSIANLAVSFTSLMDLCSNKECTIKTSANNHMTFDFSCLKSPRSCASNST